MFGMSDARAEKFLDEIIDALADFIDDVRAKGTTGADIRDNHTYLKKKLRAAIEAAMEPEGSK